MDGMLSQDEINALLNGMDNDNDNNNSNDNADMTTQDDGSVTGDNNTTNNDPGADEVLSDYEKDAVGEISNISMGTAATTLSSLLNQKVNITTPRVEVADWDHLSRKYDRPCVMLQIRYKEGLDGNNVLILKEKDVKIITDLMMGGAGNADDSEELTDLHLSAIGEAMNQMMGSAATSLSSMLNRKIDISPPNATVINLQEDIDEAEIDSFLTGKFVKISFHMEIGDLVDSTIMQLYPISFAKDMCDGVAKTMEMDSQSVTADSSAANSGNPAGAQPAAASAAAQQSQQMASQNTAQMGQPMGQPMGQTMMGNTMMNQNMGQPVNVQPAQFSAFAGGNLGNYQPENIDLIMDVPLQVTVELGRTTKSISDILDLGPGKIIELNKLAGEPIDVLVNGKYVAKGEVVVIEESFGVRITEIVNASRTGGK